MMRDDKQTAAVCCALCRRIPMDVELWTETGPTDLALRWRKKSPLSSGERCLLLVAFAVWNGGLPRVTLAQVLESLHGAQLAAVGSLLVALGTEGGRERWAAIDRWIDSQEVGRG